MSPSREETTLWARALVEELVRAGVREVVVAPGSRSTPLVMAFAEEETVRLRVHLDERSGAFFALGVGKAGGGPAALVTTSGTAGAHALPAVIEAAQSETPLLILTADRPHHLRDSDANQAIDQIRLFGPFVRAFHEVAPPRIDDHALRHLRALGVRAVAEAMGPPAGPVHLNLPFDKPLEPEEPGAALAAVPEETGLGRRDATPFVAVSTGSRAAPPEALETLAETVTAARGVVVAGPLPHPGAGEAVRRFAAAVGWPLLADPLSGARYGPAEGAHVVAAYDLFLRDEGVRQALEPEVVLRVGATPTSTALADWLVEHRGAHQVVVDGGGRWKDHLALARSYVAADPADTLLALCDVLEAGGAPGAEPDDEAAQAWRRLWRRADEAARATLAAETFAPAEAEPEVAALLVEGLPAHATLFVSSSMPVRDVDAFGLPREEPLRVLGNRGASGIDGIVSTAFGARTAGSGPLVCLVGDVAFFHDQNGLLWSREDDLAVVFVLVDNDGGGIFHHLPVSDYDPAFTRFFVTPHGLDFRHAAALHGLDLRDVEPPGLPDTVARALGRGGSTVVRVRTDAHASARKRRDVALRACAAVRDALAALTPITPIPHTR